jgi:hypothetical protein
MRLGRLLIALGRSQMRPLCALTCPYRMSLRCGDLVSHRAARAVSSQLSAPITQLCNPRHNLCTTPTQLRTQIVPPYGRIDAVGSVVAHPASQCPSRCSGQ